VQPVVHPRAVGPPTLDPQPLPVRQSLGGVLELVPAVPALEDVPVDPPDQQ
jgi:hypothetical protein